MTCYELIRVLSRCLSHEFPQVMLEKFYCLEAVTHSRVEDTSKHKSLCPMSSHDIPMISVVETLGLS